MGRVHGIGATLEVSLAKPPSDRKKKEEILKARERRLLQQHFVQRGGLVPVVPFRGGRGAIRTGSVAAAAAAASGPISYARDYDYEYGYGPYRGGYPDPYYNGYYPYAGGDYFYDYPTRGGRGRGSRSGEQRTSSPSAGGMTSSNARWRGASEGSPAAFHHSRGGRGGAGWRGGPRGGAASSSGGGGRSHTRGSGSKPSSSSAGNIRLMQLNDIMKRLDVEQ